MEKIKVYTFHSNGNDLVIKQMEAERISDNVLYVSKEEKIGNWSETYYYLVIHYKGVFVMLDRSVKIENITNVTMEYIINNYTARAENKLYFNKIELILCKAISEDLYEKALSARNYVLEKNAEQEQRKKEERLLAAQKEQDRKEQEKAQKLKEREEMKKKDEAFFKDNSDILKDNLSDFEKITAKKELNRLYRFHLFETDTKIVCSILELIRKHNYCIINSQTIKYSRDGSLLKVPRTSYYIGTIKDSLGFQIPAKLGKLIVFKNK